MAYMYDKPCVQLDVVSESSDAWCKVVVQASRPHLPPRTALALGVPAARRVLLPLPPLTARWPVRLTPHPQESTTLFNLHRILQIALSQKNLPSDGVVERQAYAFSLKGQKLARPKSEELADAAGAGFLRGSDKLKWVQGGLCLIPTSLLLSVRWRGVQGQGAPWQPQAPSCPARHAPCWQLPPLPCPQTALNRCRSVPPCLRRYVAGSKAFTVSAGKRTIANTQHMVGLGGAPASRQLPSGQLPATAWSAGHAASCRGLLPSGRHVVLRCTGRPHLHAGAALH